MPSVHQLRGTEAEDYAINFLRERNYQILGRHVTSRYGEIDILARDHDVIVAVEVKLRRSDKFGRAIEAITDTKLQKISEVLHDILEQRGWSQQPYRIDVITIEPSGINHLRGVGPG